MISLAKKWRAPIFACFIFSVFGLYSLIPNSEKCPSTPFHHENDLKKTTCLIEGSKKLRCLRDENDVYLPFDKFLKKQFDLTGKLVGKETSDERFEYFTSYSKVRVPESLDYSSSGQFGHFANYNVEIRDRVRCISAEHGKKLSLKSFSKM